MKTNMLLFAFSDFYYIPQCPHCVKLIKIIKKNKFLDETIRKINVHEMNKIKRLNGLLRAVPAISVCKNNNLLYRDFGQEPYLLSGVDLLYRDKAFLFINFLLIIINGDLEIYAKETLPIHKYNGNIFLTYIYEMCFLYCQRRMHYVLNQLNIPHDLLNY